MSVIANAILHLCKLHITVAQGFFVHKEPQPNRHAPEPKPSITRFRLPLPVVVSCSLSMAPIRPVVPSTFSLGAAMSQPQGGPATLDQLSNRHGPPSLEPGLVSPLCHGTGGPPPSTNTRTPFEKMKCFEGTCPLGNVVKFFCNSS